MTKPVPDTVRHSAGESPGHRWQAATRVPDPRLAAFVIGDYQGWREWSAAPVFRPQLPVIMVPVILNLGPGWRIGAPDVPWGAPQAFDSFAAGLHDGIATTWSGGDAACLQINLTPLALHHLARQDMQGLANRTCDLADLLGTDVLDLVARLRGTPDWPARFALVDGWLLPRLAPHAPENEVTWAIRRLRRSHGRAAIGDLAADLGWSRKRLIQRFRTEAGLPPKVIARILRFNRMLALLEDAKGRSLAELADIAGYCDQAHFNRDFRAFARTTPGEYLAARRPMAH